MAIAALDSSTYARVRFNTGPGSQMPLKLQIDYDKPFEGSDRELWLSQYKENVIFEDKLALKVKTNEKSLQRDDLFGKDIPSLDCEDIISAFELMDPYERDYLLEQLSFRNSLFPESEVF
jgi:hypothetical protein